jgi:hypothetical protein
LGLLITWIGQKHPLKASAHFISNHPSLSKLNHMARSNLLAAVNKNFLEKHDKAGGHKECNKYL